MRVTTKPALREGRILLRLAPLLTLMGFGCLLAAPFSGAAGGGLIAPLACAVAFIGAGYLALDLGIRRRLREAVRVRTG